MEPAVGSVPVVGPAEVEALVDVEAPVAVDDEAVSEVDGSVAEVPPVGSGQAARRARAARGRRIDGGYPRRSVGLGR